MTKREMALRKFVRRAVKADMILEEMIDLLKAAGETYKAEKFQESLNWFHGTWKDMDYEVERTKEQKFKGRK